MFEIVSAQYDTEVRAQMSQSHQFVAVQEALDGNKVEIDEREYRKEVFHVTALERGGTTI